MRNAFHELHALACTHSTLPPSMYCPDLRELLLLLLARAFAAERSIDARDLRRMLGLKHGL
jgi:hypothetical protein